MEKVACSVCQKPKANLECCGCHETICKNCAEFLPEGEFSFMPVVPEMLQGGAFCQPCYIHKVQPEILAYEQDVERARNVTVFDKRQTKETRHVQRLEPAVVVDHCPDREETLLRLAYLAIKAGFNGLVDVEISSKKIRNGSRQNSDWKGIGVPAEIDLTKIPKDRSIWQNPN